MGLGTHVNRSYEWTPNRYFVTIHPNLHNVTLRNITPSLISQNPREWMWHLS